MNILTLVIIVIIIISLFALLFSNNYENFTANNDKFYLAPSRIHGTGVYCRVSIPKDTILFKAIEHSKKKVTELGKKVNHCNNSNTILKMINWYLVSSKNIEKNGELTADYNNTPDYIKKPERNWTC